MKMFFLIIYNGINPCKRWRRVSGTRETVKIKKNSLPARHFLSTYSHSFTYLYFCLLRSFIISEWHQQVVCLWFLGVMYDTKSRAIEMRKAASTLSLVARLRSAQIKCGEILEWEEPAAYRSVWSFHVKLKWDRSAGFSFKGKWLTN